MFSEQFYYGIVRKSVVGFGNLFNDIIIQRLDSSGNRVQTIKVPLTYSPKEKMLARISANPNLEKSTAITLPYIGFEISSMTYDSTRKLTSTTRNKKVIVTDDKKVSYNYVPVPYNIGFTLSIFVNKADDGFQILEQIVPYFRPEFTINMNLIPFNEGFPTDIPITLDSVNISDIYDGDFDTRRVIMHSLDFTMKTYMYGPENVSGVIKRAPISIFNQTTNTKIQKITTEPDPSSALSTDDYGITVTIDEGPFDE